MGEAGSPTLWSKDPPFLPTPAQTMRTQTKERLIVPNSLEERGIIPQSTI